jgi:hypothetical protein
LAATHDDAAAVLNVTEQQVCERVATATGVAADQIERLIFVEGDTIKLTLPALKLGKNNAERTRNVARILVITRGFGLEENDTPVEVIRSEVIRLKCYDPANFSSHLSTLDGYVITGSGATRRIRAKSPGIQAFSALVDSLAGLE